MWSRDRGRGSKIVDMDDVDAGDAAGDDSSNGGRRAGPPVGYGQSRRAPGLNQPTRAVDPQLRRAHRLTESVAARDRHAGRQDEAVHGGLDTVDSLVTGVI